MELVQHINGSWGTRLESYGDCAIVDALDNGFIKLWLQRDIVARCKVADAKA